MTAVLGLRLFVVCLTAACSLGYVLRRRNWNDDAEQGLAEALPLLREERRRLEEPPQGGGVYWSDLDESDRPLDIEPRLGFADKQLLEALLNDNDDGYYEGNSINDQLQTDESRGLQKAANMAEIENILEPSDDEKDKEKEARNKKNVPIALGGPGPGKHAEKKEFDPSGGDQKREDVANVEEVNAILRNAVDEAEEAANEENAGEDSLHSVTPDELKSVLGGDQEEQIQDDVTTDGDVMSQGVPFVVDEDVEEEEEERENEEEPEESWRPSQEEFLPVFSYAPEVPAKIKRSGRKRQAYFEEKPHVVSDTGGALAREYIKRFLELEEDENTNLANALNLATMAQVERTDQFVVPEAKFIRKAIQDEQEIQQLKASLSLDEDRDEPDFGDEEEEQEEEEDEEEEPVNDEPILKRGEPIIFGDEGVDDDLDNAIDDGRGERGLSPYLAAKLRQYLEEQGLADDTEANDVQVIPPQREEWLDRPVDMDSEGLGPGGQRLNPFLRDLYQRYLDGELGNGQEEEQEEDGEEEDEEEEGRDLDDPMEQEDGADVDPALVDKMEAEIEDAFDEYLEGRQQEAPADQPEDDADDGVCPALELVDGCRYAVELGLNLDNEAMDLCNRHQLCYACGAAHGMTDEDCDNGYMSEAGDLCDAQNNAGCTNEAAGLFVLMLEAHKYNTVRETPAVCKTPCVVEFVTGETK